METVPLTFEDPLSTVEAARRLGVDVATVYALIFQGSLRGGPDPEADVKVEAASVEAWLRAGRLGGTSS